MNYKEGKIRVLKLRAVELTGGRKWRQLLNRLSERGPGQPVIGEYDVATGDTHVRNGNGPSLVGDNGRETEWESEGRHRLTIRSPQSLFSSADRQPWARETLLSLTICRCVGSASAATPVAGLRTSSNSSKSPRLSSAPAPLSTKVARVAPWGKQHCSVAPGVEIQFVQFGVSSNIKQSLKYL